MIKLPDDLFLTDKVYAAMFKKHASKIGASFIEDDKPVYLLSNRVAVMIANYDEMLKRYKIPKNARAMLLADFQVFILGMTNK